MSGPPPHAHAHTTDTFNVLEGTLPITVGDRQHEASAGTYVLVPAGVVHTLANVGAAPVRVLDINAPGGCESYLRDLSGAMRSGTTAGTAEFAQLVAQYDSVLPT